MDSEIDARITTIRREADRFASLLDPDVLTVPVPSCPGWTVRDLTDHLGGVHWWAAGATRTSPDGRVGSEPVGPTTFPELRDWFRAGAAELVDALQVDPQTPCWTLAEPGRVGFWIRRQLHETTLHRWDLETALGLPARYPEPLARDGIGEVAEMMLPRQVRLGRLASGPEAVRLEPSGGDPVTMRTRDGAVAAVSVAGTAEALLLVLWRRIGLDDPRLQISGDRSVAVRMLGGALTP